MILIAILIGCKYISILQTMREIKLFNPECTYLNVIPILLKIYAGLFVEINYFTE